MYLPDWYAFIVYKIRILKAYLIRVMKITQNTVYFNKESIFEIITV